MRYLRRVKRMDAALEILLSNQRRVLLEYQDKVRYIVDPLPSTKPQEQAKSKIGVEGKTGPPG